MKRLLVSSVLILLAGPVTPAGAHDEWDNGEPVPGWVKRACCGPADAHHLRDEQVHVTPAGYRIDGYGSIVPQERRLPSPDGSWWLFFSTYPDGSQSGVYCFFGPSFGS